MEIGATGPEAHCIGVHEAPRPIESANVVFEGLVLLRRDRHILNILYDDGCAARRWCASVADDGVGHGKGCLAIGEARGEGTPKVHGDAKYDGRVAILSQ